MTDIPGPSPNRESALSVRALLDAGAAAGAARHNPTPHGVPYTVVPWGYELKALPLDSAPLTCRTTVKLRDTASFVKYVLDHSTTDSRIYATVSPAVFLAVLDDHSTRDKEGDTPSVADWREFRAHFAMPASREWTVWTQADRKPMSQLDFARFIEDNLPDILEPDGATLLEMTLSFEAATAAQFVAQQRLQDGSHTLQWRAENNASGTVRLPEHIGLAIPVFELEEPQALMARLRYRVADGKLAIWYELVRPHKVLETAFRDAWQRIAEGTGVPILLGTPE